MEVIGVVTNSVETEVDAGRVLVTTIVRGGPASIVE